MIEDQSSDLALVLVLVLEGCGNKVSVSGKRKIWGDATRDVLGRDFHFGFHHFSLSFSFLETVVIVST